MKFKYKMLTNLIGLAAKYLLMTFYLALALAFLLENKDYVGSSICFILTYIIKNGKWIIKNLLDD